MSKPVVWTIAGSDTGGGAGIQADIKTINGLGAHGASVITALTAQNTMRVEKIDPVQPEIIKAQIDALKVDLIPQAVKLGMLYSAECVEVVAQAIGGLGACIICDPVLVSTTGDSLAEPRFLDKLKVQLLPLADLLTPNLHEAHCLLGLSAKSFESNRNEIERDEYLQEVARKLLALGPKAVLLKRGDDRGEYSQDYWTNGKQSAWLTSGRRLTRSTHGTGCTLSSAIAASLALGYSELDAVVIGKAYVNQGLRLAPGVGSGHGPLAHLGWPENQEDLPWLTNTALAGRSRREFLECGTEPLGFYPIVDSLRRTKELISMGVRTIQLRIKTAPNGQLEQEVKQAIELARKHSCRLFLNDYWQLAVKHQAYGVHLGQEDLESADLDALMHAGIRLGVSTHNYIEVARALALKPSYIAVGPIHPTTSKEVGFPPQGIEGLKRWRRSLKCPLVAIGGISLDNAQEVLDAGADAIAVIRDVAASSNGEARVKAWLELFKRQHSDMLHN